ncbi:MAG: methyltransferase [Candidatus Riflebacteria bacterium]|nr:methyltransferase [Candidatus Riflebacteria bacterium]
MADSADFNVDDADVPALRDILARIAATGYSESAVSERLSLKDINDLQMRALPIYRTECLSARTSLDTAIDLFLLQGTIRVEELDGLFCRRDRDVMLRAKILSIDSFGSVRANVSLYPVRDHLVFSDHAWPQLFNAEYSTVPYDQVMFVGTDSRWLARATVRQPVRTALDLCTGSGIQALLAATHARRAVAVDINLRAVCCTKFNAKVSGFHNIEVVAGDLFEPIGNELFDLITANPPFVPSPVDGIRFRDGGRSGEDVQRRIVAGLPSHLASGGTAQLVTEFGERSGEPLTDRIRQWLGDAPMDIHVVRLRTHSAAAYAIGHATGDDPETFLKSVEAWATNLRTQGIVRVVSVLVAFQWSDPSLGSPWSRVDEALPPRRDAGAEIETVFAAERTAQDPRLQEKFQRCRLMRTGPITLLEGVVLGSELPPTCQATLMGQALSIDHRLNHLERDLLKFLDHQMEGPALLSVAQQASMSEEILFGTIRSLLGKGLIRLIDSGL